MGPWKVSEYKMLVNALNKFHSKFGFTGGSVLLLYQGLNLGFEHVLTDFLFKIH